MDIQPFQQVAAFGLHHHAPRRGPSGVEAPGILG